MRHMLKVAAAGLTAAALIAPVAQAAGQATPAAPSPGSAGIGDPYFPTDGNGGYDVASYDIRNTYSFANHAIKGRTTIRAKATQALSRFNVDLKLKASAVTVNGAKASFTRSGDHELVVAPAKSLAKGASMTVVVDYAGVLPRASFSSGGTYWTDDEVMATNQPHVATTWFASNDHPADKARVTTTITTSKNVQVIGNGRQTKRTVKGGLATTTWTARDPMATYLAFFAAGRFTVKKGTYQGLPWLDAVSKGLPPKQQEKSMALLATAPKIVKWLQSQLGAYPFESSGGITTSISRGFALENQTRSTYDYWGGPEARSVVVHENAHQWFGDDVALHRWKDIWLNEGFASFMEWLYAEKVGGQGTTGQFLLQSYNGYNAQSSFWKTKPGDPGADRIFSGAVYERGAMTVAALRNRVGDADFAKVLRRYYAAQSDGNATTPDLVAIAEKVSGEDLDGFFDAWLYTAKKPAKTKANGLGGMLTLEQAAEAAKLSRTFTFTSPEALATFHGVR